MTALQYRFSFILFVIVIGVGYLVIRQPEDNSSQEGLSANRNVETNRDPTEISMSKGTRLTQTAIQGINEQSRQQLEDGDLIATLDVQFRDARAMLNDRDRQTALKVVARKLAKSDPGMAKSLFNEFLPVTRRKQSDAVTFIRDFMDEYASTHPEDALAWTESLPDSVVFDAYHSIARAWAQSDPLSATDWILGIPESQTQFDLVREIGELIKNSQSNSLINNWAAKVAQSPQGYHQSDLLARVWSTANPQATFEWASSIPASDSKQLAFASMVSNLREQDHRIAAEWANKFPDELGIREQAIQSTLYFWNKLDPDAARNWADSQGIGMQQDPNLPGVSAPALSINPLDGE